MDPLKLTNYNTAIAQHHTSFLSPEHNLDLTRFLNNNKSDCFGDMKGTTCHYKVRVDWF